MEIPGSPIYVPVFRNYLTFRLCSFIKRLIKFVNSGPYINPSRYDPTFLYNGPGPYNNSGTFICNDTGSLLMLLSVGRCVKSCLMRPVNAPTAKGKDQNYYKHIDVKLHTVEFERLASALGMVSHQSTVNTSLENGNDLRFTTRSNPAPDSKYDSRNCDPYPLIFCILAASSSSGPGISPFVSPAAKATSSNHASGTKVQPHLGPFHAGELIVCI